MESPLSCCTAESNLSIKAIDTKGNTQMKARNKDYKNGKCEALALLFLVCPVAEVYGWPVHTLSFIVLVFCSVHL